MGPELPVERIWQPNTWLCTKPQFQCLCTNTGGHVKYVLLGVRPPYFGAELVFDVINECTTVYGAWAL